MDVQRRSVVVNACVTVLYWQGRRKKETECEMVEISPNGLSKMERIRGTSQKLSQI